jgi:ATP-dependent Clp protease ATP-binding subunit ClpA
MADDLWRVTWDADAQDVFRRIKEEAAAVGDDYFGTPHLLLAVVALTPVERHGIAALNLATVRAAVIAVTGPRDPDIRTLTRWSQTPRLKLAIERAMRRASAAARPVRCGDIWHGLLADPESEVARVLRHLGIQVEELSRAFAEPDAQQTGAAYRHRTV